jgi:hypothetical protein
MSNVRKRVSANKGEGILMIRAWGEILFLNGKQTQTSFLTIAWTSIYSHMSRSYWVRNVYAENWAQFVQSS